jgi:hypothetical protein
MSAISISNDWFRCGFSTCYKQCAGKRFYTSYPNLSRGLGTFIAVISGIINTCLFPLKALSGIVVLPIIGCCRKKILPYLQAGALSALGFLGTLAFMTLSGFTFPLTLSLAIIVSSIAISIIFHIHDVCKAPL